MSGKCKVIGTITLLFCLFLWLPVLAVANTVENDSGQSKDYKMEQFGLNLVATQSQTIKDDLNIRLTQAGLNYLAKTLKLALTGFVPSLDYTMAGKTAATIPAVLNDGMSGTYSYVLDFLGCSFCLYMRPRVPNMGTTCECATAPSQAWGSKHTLYHCDNCAADANPGNLRFPSGIVSSLSVNDPFDPSPNPPPVTFKIPPFYKETLSFHKWSGHNSANVFTSDDCIPNQATGNYPNANCDPLSPKVGIFPDPAAQQLRIKLMLYDVIIHGKILVKKNSSLNPACWLLPDQMDETSPGMATVSQVGIRMNARFIDGYSAMLGNDGAVPVGGGLPPPPLSCDQAPPGGTTPPIPPNITDGALMDIEAKVAAGVATKQASCWGVLNSNGYCAASINLHLSGLLGGIIGAVDGLLQGMLADAIISALNTQIGNLLRDTVGLPLDFNQLFAGGPSTRNDICGIRSVAGIGGCFHGTNGANGTCACDNRDNNDTVLNYQQDTNDALFLTGIDPATGLYWDENMYGVGTGTGGWTNQNGTVYTAPSYDIGAYISAKYDSNGIGLLADLAMIPKAATVLSNSCFNGTVYSDITGPDWNPAIRTNAATPPFNSWDSVVMTGGGVAKQHIIIGVSQYDLEEVFNAFLTSGMLCFVIDKDFLGLGDMMRISNFKSIVPALDKPAARLDYYPSDYIQVVMRPTGVPTVRVLGGRTTAGWPAGDCIPNDGANIHTNTKLKVLQAAVPCPLPSAIPAPRGHNTAYDLMAAFPQFKLDFYAPFRGNLNDKRILFTLNIDLVLTMAIEATRNGNIMVFQKSETKFLELLIEPWLGCSGTILNTAGTGLPTTCLTTGQFGTGILTKGIASLLVTLLNARFGLLLRTTFNISGLGMDFGLIGMFPDGYNSVYDVDDNSVGNSTKKYKSYGAGSNDFLGISAVFAGALDFGKIFSLVGGSLAPAPYMIEPETYIIPDGPLVSLGSQDHMPGTWYDLSPGESAAFGFTPEGTRFDLVSAPALAKLDQDGSDILYSYRYDYGMWSPFKPITEIGFKYLVDGHHILEVRASGGDRYVDSTPARVAFWIDSQPPDIALNIDGKISRVSERDIQMRTDDTMVLAIEDNVTQGDNLRSSWRLNAGRWHPYYSDTRLLLPVKEGRRNILSVRSTDEFGNSASQNFFLDVGAAEQGFGCSATSAATGWDMLLLLFLLLGGGMLLRDRECTS